MKHRAAFWLFTAATPFLAAALLALGSQWNESLGGRLIQVVGACLALVWVTAMFLIVGVTVTRVLGLSDTLGSAEEKADAGSMPPPRRRAA